MSTSTGPIPNIGTAYDVEGEVGRGGMATVYRAYDRRHNRRVAVKVLDREVAASLGTARFLHEITTAAGISNPNIVPFHDSGEH
ncbi:MAG: serine/threonine protein kinase, partial [Gemmatimonadota bacterium]|nr:serine/threonine protein kinase [Gemmatimonadota bacterium]